MQEDRCNDKRDYQVWQQPKRSAKAKITSNSNQLDLNRYDMLKDNEWLRNADDSDNTESNSP